MGVAHENRAKAYFLRQFARESEDRRFFDFMDDINAIPVGADAMRHREPEIYTWQMAAPDPGKLSSYLHLTTVGPLTPEGRIDRGALRRVMEGRCYFYANLREVRRRNHLILTGRVAYSAPDGQWGVWIWKPLGVRP